MKKLLNKMLAITFAFCLVSSLSSCKDTNKPSENEGAGGIGNEETYAPENSSEKTEAAESPGQNIGNNTDSTDIDSPEPNPSNN